MTLREALDNHIRETHKLHHGEQVLMAKELGICLRSVSVHMKRLGLPTHRQMVKQATQELTES